MKYGKYLKVLGLAISFPSTILSLAFGVHKLVEQELVSGMWALVYFLSSSLTFCG